MSFTSKIKDEIRNYKYTTKHCINIKTQLDKIIDNGVGSIDPKDYKRICCKKTILREAFLRCGQVTKPQNGYRMEYIIASEDVLNIVSEQLIYFDINYNVTVRNGKYVIYIKEADSIIENLHIVGATTLILEIENQRIIGEVKSKINRQVNCETYNIKKTVASSQKQISDIELIDKKIGLENIDPRLREIANIRLINPDASMQKISELVSNTSKSGINHRFRKIHMMAEGLRKS